VTLLKSQHESTRQLERAQDWVRQDGTALDVSELPSFAFSHRALTWWATAGMMVIEGVVFGLAIMTYFYLRSHSVTWPMSRPPPELRWGTVNALVLLVSLVPNQWAKAAAEKLDLAKVRIGLLLCLAFGLAFIVVRGYEFTALNCRWDDNAYGSIVWVLMGLHTLHLVTDVLDTAVLCALLFSERPDGKRFVDVSENALYWYFVVLSWLPIYAVIYWAPRSL
jgi:heme/copper-type cytochrome/quinol oxidase subunit 3